MASLDDLFSQIPISQIAQQLGVDEATATTAVKSTIPTLLGGLQANAQDAGGAASLTDALSAHGTLLDQGVDISKINVADGQKIVSNVFGGAQDQVVSTLGGVGGAGGNQLISKLLPILAPIVLAYLAKQFTGGNAQAAPQAQAQAPASGGGGIGDILGSILGGAGGGQQAAAGGLGNILGSVLGGNSGGALGNVLGGLLGGGKR